MKHSLLGEIMVDTDYFFDVSFKTFRLVLELSSFLLTPDYNYSIFKHIVSFAAVIRVVTQRSSSLPP